MLSDIIKLIRLKMVQVNKKGFMYTLDAVLSIVLMMTFIVAIVFFVNQDQNIYHSQSLEMISMSGLTMLEKGGVLKSTIETGLNDSLINFMENLPAQVCGSIVLKDYNETIVFDELNKTNCNSPDEYIYVRRSFIVNYLPYLAELKTWYKE